LRGDQKVGERRALAPADYVAAPGGDIIPLVKGAREQLTKGDQASAIAAVENVLARLRG
jgi:hypothetical protein